jgi:Flp pilus assembly protein TadG
MKNRLLKLLGRYRRNETGIAAVEFALVSPIFFMLLLGGTEVGRYILVHQKAEKMAYSVSDVISQLDSVTSGDVDVVFGAASEPMNPYDKFETRGTLFLSSVHKDPDDADQTIRQGAGGNSARALAR